MLGVGGVVVAAVHQLANAAPGHVAEVVPARRVAGVAGPPAERVEQHALAQRGLGERERPDVERFGDRRQDDRPGHDDVGAARLQAGELGPGRRRAMAHQLGDDAIEFVPRELEAVVGAQRLGTVRGMHHPRNRLGRAR